MCCQNYYFARHTTQGFINKFLDYSAPAFFVSPYNVFNPEIGSIFLNFYIQKKVETR